MRLIVVSCLLQFSLPMHSCDIAGDKNPMPVPMLRLQTAPKKGSRSFYDKCLNFKTSYSFGLGKNMQLVLSIK